MTEDDSWEGERQEGREKEDLHGVMDMVTFLCSFRTASMAAVPEALTMVKNLCAVCHAVRFPYAAPNKVPKSGFWILVPKTEIWGSRAKMSVKMSRKKTHPLLTIASAKLMYKVAPTAWVLVSNGRVSFEKESEVVPLHGTVRFSLHWVPVRNTAFTTGEFTME